MTISNHDPTCRGTLDGPIADDMVPSLVLSGIKSISSGIYKPEITSLTIYSVGIDPDPHFWVLWKVIQANGERNDLDKINLFCFTLRDVISEWGENFMQSQFVKLEVGFCKWYLKVQINE
jgi:hypothetical protein